MSENGLKHWRGVTDITRMSPALTDGQMEAIEKRIATSPDASAIGKRAIIYLLRQSRNLTQAVRMSIPPLEWGEPEDEGLHYQVAKSQHDMVSSAHPTELHLMFKAANTNTFFCAHDGVYTPDGQFLSGRDHEGAHPGATIWLSTWWYNNGGPDSAREVPFDLDAIQAVRFPDETDSRDPYQQTHKRILRRVTV